MIGQCFVNGGPEVCINRTLLDFDLSPLKKYLNPAVINVTVNYSGMRNTYTYKITKVTTRRSSFEDIWADIANGGVLHNDIPANGSSFLSAPIVALLNNTLCTGRCFIGAMSNMENQSNSYTNFNFSLHVEFSYQVPVLEITVKNDLEGKEGGNIKVSKNADTLAQHPSPYTIEIHENDKLNLAAIDDQIIDDTKYIFNDNEGVANYSQWHLKLNGVTKRIYQSQEFTTDKFLLDDNYYQCIAYLKDATMTKSGVMLQNENWFQNVTLAGDVAVPSGVTLTIMNPVAVNLNGHTLYSTGGVINMENGAAINGSVALIKSGISTVGYSGSAQSAVYVATGNQIVELQSRMYNENLSLTSKNNVTIAGAGPASTVINGSINLSSANNCTVKDLRVPEYKYISINGGDNNCISNIQTDNYADVLNIYDASNVKVQGLIAENGMDIGSNIRNSDGNIWAGNSYSGHLTALYFSSNSSFYLSENNFCNNNIDVNSQSSYIIIKNNFLSKPYPQSLYGNYLFQGYSNVCPSGSSPAKTSSPESKTQLAASGVSNPVNTELDEADKAYMDLFSKINKENTRSNKILKTDVYTVIDKFRKVLSTKKDKYSVNRSLLRLSHCFRTTESRKEFNDMIETMLKDKSYEGIQGNIKRYLIGGYIQNREYARAANLAEEIINSSEDEDLTCDMLYEKAMICRDYLEDSETAIKAFSQIKENYPNNPVARMAGVQLKVMGVEEKKQEGKVKKESSKVEGFGSSNYPNPFNPATTISFSIPKDGMTELKIYNMLGENIETLVSQPLSAGTYSYSWNAARYSSGIYFYVLRSGNNVQTKRMMLVK